MLYKLEIRIKAHLLTVFLEQKCLDIPIYFFQPYVFIFQTFIPI